MKHVETHRQLNTRVTCELFGRLYAEAAKQGRPRTEMVIQALTEYLDEKDGGPPRRPDQIVWDA